MSSLVYLLEDFDPNLFPPRGQALVVSLKPRVSRLLEEHRIPYFILENFYCETELRAHEEDYFLDQRKWFCEFDEFLKENIQPCREWNLRLASVHYNRLKYLIDSVVFRAAILSAFLNKVKTEEVIYVVNVKDEEGAPSLYNFNRRDRTSYLGILQLLAAERFPSLIIKRHVTSDKMGNHLGKRDAPFSTEAFKKFLVKALNLKCLFNFYRYRKLKGRIPSCEDFRGITVLMLDSGTEAMDTVTRELIRHGAKVFIKNERETYLASEPFGGGTMSLEDVGGTECGSNVEKECREAFQKFKRGGLFAWINGRCRFDAGSLLLPYFENFITVVCPKVLSSVEKFISFYREERIEFAIARGSAGENYPAPLLAAETLGIKRVCFQHGADPTDAKDWVVDELDFFDVNFVMNSSTCEYFRAQSQNGSVYPCEVLESSHYLRKIRDSVKVKNKKKGLSVFYVPAKLAHGMIKFNGVVYPMTWYYEHQKQLLTFFGSRGDLEFIYKHSPPQKWVEDSLFPWLCERHFKNISIRSAPFPSYLREAGRVIFDRPSTGFFEAATAGVPALCLYHETIKIWPPMFRVFGKSLQKFSTTEEALKKIEEFLDRDSEEYRVDLQLSPNSVVELLNKVRGGRALSHAR